MSILRTSLLSFALFLSISITAQTSWGLDDFLDTNPLLSSRVDAIYNQLSTEERVAQMIITSAGKLGKADKTVQQLAADGYIGGVVFLKGSSSSHKSLVNSLDLMAYNAKSIPMIYSMDAEPSLFNGRISDTAPLLNTSAIGTSEECDSIVSIIDTKLQEIGIHHNYAPVCDLSTSNAAITNRSFGRNEAHVINMSRAFIESTQHDNIVACAKHFPGHGLVTGDTHKQSVYIDGELKELPVYQPLIDAGVLSIMIAHITIENNATYGTNGLPSSCSRTIVTDLLREELGFEGLIISDALNIMKAVTVLDKAPLLASKAGCDFILMPQDEALTMQWVMEEMALDETYNRQVEESVKRILRLKLCLGLLH